MGFEINHATSVKELKSLAGTADQPTNLSVALVKVFKLQNETSGDMMKQIKLLTDDDKAYFRSLFSGELGWNF